MPEVSVLNDLIKSLLVTYPDSNPPVVITVKYRTAEYTGEWLRKWMDEDIYWGISNIVSEWDLTENGKMVPLDIDSLKRVPMRLLRAIDEAIHKDQIPNQERLTDSENSW